MRVSPSIVLFSYPLGFDPQYVVYDYESFVTVNNYPFLLSKGGLGSVLSFSRNGQPAILLDCGSEDFPTVSDQEEGCTEFSIIYEVL